MVRARCLGGLLALSFLCGACQREGKSPSKATNLQAAPYFVCRYQNPFTHVEECKEYRGEAFDESAAKQACAKPFTGVTGTLSKVACPRDGALGTCSEGQGTPELVVTWAYGGFRSIYAGACEGFVGGTWSDEARVPVVEPPIKLMEEAKRALLSTDTVRVEPSCGDEVCLTKLVHTRGALWFRPRTRSYEDALLLYPGAAVDPRAYAPLALAIAAEGVAVAIVPMQGNLALTGIDRARDVIQATPEIKRWFLGGHSLGGAMAARFAARGEGRSQLAGLILWAAFPPEEDDLSQAALPVLSVFGSEDGRTTLSEVEAARKLLPAHTRYQRIEGGNHAQFGWYGAQEGDRPAHIERAQQQSMIVAATLSFMRSAASPVPRDPRFGLAAERDRSLCRAAQVSLANVGTLAEDATASEEILSPKQFAVAKARIEGGSVPRVHAIQRTVQRGQTDKLDAPAVLSREVWCKLKNQEVLSAAFARQATGSERGCQDLNQATIDWVTAHLTVDELRRLRTSGRVLETVADQSLATGPEWLAKGTLELESYVSKVESPAKILVRSAALVVPVSAPVEEAFRGVHYCKLLATEEALLRMLSPRVAD